MEFGINLGNMGPLATAENMLAIARRAVELQFDAVWLGDHIFVPYRQESRYPYNATGRMAASPDHNVLDPLMTLAYVGGAVNPPRLGVGVLIVPYRNPVATAKMLMTLDHLSGGKLTVGVGVGWMTEEFDAVGASHEHRGSVTDEYIRIFKELCTSEEPTFEGEHYRFSDVGAFHPKPVQKPHPPVWVGGWSRPALRRAARLGDCWYPSNIDPDAYAAKLDYLRRFCLEHGRDPSSLGLAVHVNNVGFGEKDAYGRSGVAPFSGTAQQILDNVHKYQDAGIGHISMNIKGAGVQERLDNMERFAEQVRPRV